MSQMRWNAMSEDAKAKAFSKFMKDNGKNYTRTTFMSVCQYERPCSGQPQQRLKTSHGQGNPNGLPV